MNKILLFFLLILMNGYTVAQDTTRYEHKFRLPVKDNQLGYEKKISQYATDVHQFKFEVPDSCKVYIVVRSLYDSLAIWIGNTNIDLSSKKDQEYTYGFVEKLPKGLNTVFIRTKKYCTYKIYIKGQL